MSRDDGAACPDGHGWPMLREPFQRCGAAFVLWLCLASPAIGAGSNEAAIAAGNEATEEGPVAPREPVAPGVSVVRRAPAAASGKRTSVDRAADRPLFRSLARAGGKSAGSSPSGGGGSWILTTCLLAPKLCHSSLILSL